MVVNGSKSGEKPLLPFFFELWSNNKNTTEKHKLLCIFRRFYLFRARSLFVVEHVLGKDEVTGSNPVSSSMIADEKAARQKPMKNNTFFMGFFYFKRQNARFLKEEQK